MKTMGTRLKTPKGSADFCLGELCFVVAPHGLCDRVLPKLSTGDKQWAEPQGSSILGQLDVSVCIVCRGLDCGN